ncbi:metallophosphoesterase [Paenibacillus tarimensis]|uniref:metallophosphoesterase n=1 Tax=Paenibacillus tarimensis TaxID=416012 RepID=UPI001F1D2179|nr:metallophosphoesterase [Paenibacillus tarimensis]MCF2942510.1 metallophosphoesterase [Paenibacillus tarimensis]
MFTAAALLSAGIMAFVVIWMLKEAYCTAVHSEEVRLNHLPASFDGTRIFFVSDIHRRRLPLKLLDDPVLSEGVDLVLIGGDLREGGVPLERTRANVQLLSSLGPVYAVYGNHDHDEPVRELEVLLNEERVRVLVNESVMLEKQDGSVIRLAGVDDPKTRRDRLGLALGNNDEATAGRKEPFTLLLAHDPIIAERLPGGEGNRIDLILAGHTHGGQIVVPFAGAVINSRSLKLFPRGWFQLQQSGAAIGRECRMLVSRGFGTSKIPLRLRAPAEAHLLTLRYCNRPE